MIRLLSIGILTALLYLLQRQVYSRCWQKGLTVDISFAKEHIFCGEKGQLREVVENRKRLPLAMLKVKFQTDRNLVFDSGKGSSTTDRFYRNDVFRIGSGEKVTRTLSFTGGRRGYYTIKGASLVASDLFWDAMFTADTPADAFLYVYPRPCLDGELLRSLTKWNGEVLARRHLLEDPFEYRGIREYQPFDTMRSINWKATAKTGELKVNQKNYTALKSVRVFLNVQDDGVLKKEDCVEYAVSVAAGLCAFFLNQGIQVSCHANGVDVFNGRPVDIAARAGEGQMDAIYRALARMDLKKQTADFCESFKERIFAQADETVTCFVSPNQYEDFLSLLAGFGEAGHTYRWFYPLAESREPLLPAGIAENVTFLHMG